MNQNSRTIQDAVAAVVGKYPVDSLPSEISSGNADMQAFCPENIFWSRDTAFLPQDAQLLWKEVLSLGWGLMKDSGQLAPARSTDAFLAKLQSLAHQVREKLFGRTILQAGESLSSNDMNILQILVDIQKKWQASSAPTAFDQQDTLIFETSEKVTEEVPPPVFEEAAWEGGETVILNQGKEAIAAASSSVPDSAFMEETVVMQTGKGRAEGSAKKELESEQESDMLPETVILTPEELAKLTKKKN